jgi:hypothetical protein
MKRALWLSLLVLAGCTTTSWDTEGPNVVTITGSYDGEPAQLSLATERFSHDFGDSISVTFGFTNLGDRPIDLWFGEANGFCYFSAHDARGWLLWRCPEIDMPVIVEMTIEPQETMEKTAVWATASAPRPSLNPVTVTGEMHSGLLPSPSAISLNLTLAP